MGDDYSSMSTVEWVLVFLLGIVILACALLAGCAASKLPDPEQYAVPEAKAVQQARPEQVPEVSEHEAVSPSVETEGDVESDVTTTRETRQRSEQTTVSEQDTEGQTGEVSRDVEADTVTQHVTQERQDHDLGSNQLSLENERLQAQLEAQDAQLREQRRGYAAVVGLALVLLVAGNPFQGKWEPVLSLVVIGVGVAIIAFAWMPGISQLI